MPNQRNRYPARRRFLKQSAALTASASLAAPAVVLAAPATAVQLQLDGGDAAAAALARRYGAELARVLQQPVRVIERPAAADSAANVLRLQPARDGTAADASALATLQAGSCRLALLADARLAPALTAAAVAAARALRA